MSKKVDIKKLTQHQLPMLGLRMGSCFQFKLVEEDYITQITVKHSTNTINVLEFKTQQGQVKTVGSQQSDSNNMFNWKTSVIKFDEHERLQGGFAHIKHVMGAMQLSSIGFLKSDCWFGPKAKKETSERVDPTPVPVVNNLNQLPTRDEYGKSTERPFESHSGSPGETELVRKESQLGLVILMILTIIACCICGYFILKNRGKCFRKLSHKEREEKLPNTS